MFKKILCLIIVWSACMHFAFGQNPGKIYDLKAAYIYKFIRYINWENTISDTFTIGVIGTSPVYYSLQKIARTKKVNNKRIVVLHFNGPDDITPCNIIYITANSYFSLANVLARIDKGTLTISEEPGFAELGTAFNFVLDHDKLKFEVNKNSINEEGLKVSSQLLKLAIIVN